MNTETVTLFFAMLAICSGALAAVVAISAVSGDRLGIIAQLRPVSVELACAIAVTATGGSLYLSEVANFQPCYLCWVQRSFMYPAAIVLLAALVTRNRWLVRAGGLLALLGLPVSIFHRVDQAVGGFGDFCDPVNPCSLQWLDHFGFVTIPTMAAAGFLGILALVAVDQFGGTTTE